MRLPPKVVAIAVLLLLPVAVLAPSLFGGKVFVPFDHRVFAPWSLALSAAELAPLRRTANFDITEKTLVNAPELRLAHSELTRGRFPAWDPWARGGGPLFANGISGLAYLPGIAQLTATPEPRFAWMAWLHAGIASVLMFGLLRELGLGLAAATLGAIVFAWSGTMAARLHLYQHYATLVWLPAALWAIERLRRGGGARALLALAAATALTWTAGYPPAAIAATLVGGAWLATVAFADARRAPGAAAFTLGRGLAGAALGLALAAYLLAPMAAYHLETGRDVDRALLDLRRGNTLDPAGWLGFLLESPFSTPALNRDGGVPHNKPPLLWLLHSRAGEPGIAPNLCATEQRLYCGALVLLLAPLGLTSRQRGTSTRAWLIGAGVLAAAAGGSVFAALARSLPGVAFLQPMALIAPLGCLMALAAACGLERCVAAPRTCLVAAVAAAVMAALAAVGWWWLAALPADGALAMFLDGMQARWGEVFRASGRAAVADFFAATLPPAQALLIDNLRWACASFAAAAAVLTLLARHPRPGALAAIALVALELITLARPLAPHHAPPPAGDTALHRFLRAARARAADAGGFTVARVAPATAHGGVAAPVTPTALPPNLLLTERIRDLNAYAFVDGRSHVPFRELWSDCPVPILLRGRWLAALPDDERLAHPLLDVFGVRYLLCHVPPKGAPPRHAGTEVLRIGGVAGDCFLVHERPRPCPRAVVVPRADVLADDAQVLSAMLQRDFAPRDRVLLARGEVTPPVAQALRDTAASNGAAVADRSGDVTFAVDEGSQVVLRVPRCGGGWLLVADAFLAGWTATVNGAPAPLVRADLCLRAVPVPPGDVTVDLRYRPPWLRTGVATSAVALLLAGVLLWRSRPRSEGIESRCIVPARPRRARL